MSSGGAARSEGTGRSCIGLGLVGQGLAVLSGVVPHEEPLVAYGLIAFGAALVATGALPSFPAARRWHLAALGGALLAIVGAAWGITGNAPVGPMLLLVILAGGVVGAALLHARVVRVRGRAFPVPDLALCSAVAVGAPVLVWIAQATFKRFSGATPLEAFEIAFLVVPMSLALTALGIPTSVRGQTLTLPGPEGQFAVEVGVACSGLQAMALFLGMLALFAVAKRPGGRRLATWTAIGLCGVYVANVVRLIVVVLAGHEWGAEALLSVHANAGWIFFVAWTLLFGLYVRRDLDRAGVPA